MSDTRSSKRASWKQTAMVCVFIFVGLMVAGVWGFAYLGTDARILRATRRLAERVQKSGEESPVALGLAANHLKERLAETATLSVSDEYNLELEGALEITQLFTQIRAHSDWIALEGMRMGILRGERGARDVQVETTFRLQTIAGPVMEGFASAVLYWRKNEEGWLVRRAEIRLDPDRFHVTETP